MSNSGDFIKLNVGGVRYVTGVTTLASSGKDSFFAKMFGGEWNKHYLDEKGYIMLDRDGPAFRHILSYLRDGVVPQLLQDPDMLYKVKAEADYFLLESLQEQLDLQIQTYQARLSMSSRAVATPGVNSLGMLSRK